MWRNDFVRKMMSNSVAQGLNFGSRWLLNLALARHLLQQDFGVFSFIYMLANLFFPAIAFGASFYLIHHGARAQKISLLLQSLKISGWVFGLMTVATILICQLLDAELPIVLYLLSLLIGLSWALNQACFSYLKGRQQFSAEVRSQFASVLLTLVLVALIFAGWLSDITMVLLAILLVSLAPHWTAWRALQPEWQQYQREKLSQPPLPVWHNWRQRLSYAWHDVFAIYLTNIPFVFLALFSTLLALGQFRQAFVLYMPVTLLPVVFSQVLLAKLSHQTGRPAQLALFRKVMLWSLPVLSLPYLLLHLVSPWLYPWLLAEQWHDETALVCTLVVSTMWLTLVKTYFEVWLTALGLMKWRAMAVTGVALLGSAGYLLAYRQLGAVLAAWIFFATNLLAVVVMALLSVWGWRRERQQALVS